MAIRIKRIYDPVAADDGIRILVDRLWPRGISKDRAQLDYWAKQASPSNDLRQWYQHDPARWHEFRKRYRSELESNPDALVELKQQMTGDTVTLLFSSSGCSLLAKAEKYC